MAAAIVLGVLGWAFAVFQQIQFASARREDAARAEAALAVERRRADGLIAQVQANAQGFQHYPTIGPLEPEPEKKYLTDDTGLIVFEVEEDDEADFEAVTG